MSVLYDATEAADAEAVGVDCSTLFHHPNDDKATELVWAEVVNAMKAGAWEEAKAGKRAVEQSERRVRRQRETDGERWTPKIFDWDGDAGTWPLKKQEHYGLKEQIHTRCAIGGDAGGGSGQHGEGETIMFLDDDEQGEREPLRAPAHLVMDGAQGVAGASAA